MRVFPGSFDHLRAAHDGGLRTTVVTASANGERVIRSAGLEPLIEQRVTAWSRTARAGRQAAADMFLAAARLPGASDSEERGGDPVPGRSRGWSR